jgi:hypothetical protein
MRANAEFRRHYQAMLRLPAGDRAIVELVELDGLTPVQAAEALRVLPSLARLRLTRAQRRLAGPVAPPAVAEDDDLGLDEVGPLELEVLGELRTILYEPDRGARAVRPAPQGHHQAIAGSRRYVAVPVLVVSLVAVLGGAFAATRRTVRPCSARTAASAGPATSSTPGRPGDHHHRPGRDLLAPTLGGGLSRWLARAGRPAAGRRPCRAGRRRPARRRPRPRA